MMSQEWMRQFCAPMLRAWFSPLALKGIFSVVPMCPEGCFEAKNERLYTDREDALFRGTVASGTGNKVRSPQGCSSPNWKRCTSEVLN
jgi:hypothetical protein